MPHRFFGYTHDCTAQYHVFSFLSLWEIRLILRSTGFGDFIMLFRQATWTDLPSNHHLIRIF